MDENFWRNAPKAYCDNVNVAVGKGDLGDMFMLAVLSGGNAQVFAFTPQHMKRMSQLLNYHITEYENTSGKIEVEEWSPNLKSPIQFGEGSNSKK